MPGIVLGPGHMAANGIDLHPMCAVWARQTRDQELPYIRVSAMDSGLLLSPLPFLFLNQNQGIITCTECNIFSWASERNR